MGTRGSPPTVRHRVYTRFIEIGRVVLILEGEFKNKVRRTVYPQWFIDCRIRQYTHSPLRGY